VELYCVNILCEIVDCSAKLAESTEILQAQVSELQQFVSTNSGSSTSKEERIKQLGHLKSTLQNDITNIFGQVSLENNFLFWTVLTSITLFSWVLHLASVMWIRCRWHRTKLCLKN
jgi:prophage DNA circulation protein